jgi:hypothetical protein
MKMTVSWLFRIPTDVTGEIFEFLESPNCVFRLALSSKRMANLLICSPRWKRLWAQVFARLCTKFNLTPLTCTLACPNTVQNLRSRAMMRCDICCVNNARRFMVNTFQCDRCSRLQPSGRNIGRSNINQAIVWFSMGDGGASICPCVRATVAYTCVGNQARYESTIATIQQIQTSFANHVKISVDDLSCVLWQSYDCLYTHLVYKIFYRTFDFTNVSYPVSWIPHDYAYYLEHVVPTQYVFTHARETHDRFSVIYQNITSKLTYATGHHDDSMVRRLIHSFSLAPHTLLSTHTIADTSAFLVYLIQQLLPRDVPLRVISNDSMTGCSICTEQFGKVCNVDENIFRCKHCCFLNTPHCATHIHRVSSSE